MNKPYLKTILTLISALIITNTYGQSSADGLWNKSRSKEIEGEKVRRSSFPADFHLFELNLNLLKTKLLNAPVLFASSNQSNLVLEFPNSDGNFEKFAVYESSIMDPILEAKFPMIKTYAAQGIDDPTATMRFSVTQFGLHTMSLSGIKSTNFIDPYTTDLGTYIVYNRISLGADPQSFECLTDESVVLPSLQKNNGSGNLTIQNINDQKLRTYRLAQSCTGEYGAIFMGTGTTAQQKANVQAQMAITMNRVNGVYERDLAIHMNFIANNDLLIYLAAATDPWTTEWNTKTAQTIDAAIGVANYDIGHNFNTTGGGNAGCLSCVCLSTSQTATHKGRGYTGRANPTGDAFDIDYVAHEMGHQYGGYHVMNTCSRSGSGSTEVEPASGSSIMGYAGICTSNVQSNSDDDFNYVNVRDISINIKTGNSTCAAITTLTNTPPTANAGLDYVIPKSTAYILEGTGSDIDGTASLTYNWSQNDPAQSPGNASPLSTYATGPLYRSISPTISPNRYMPALATVISNTLASTWEVTPSVARTMNFSFIVRDNNVGGGQTASDLMLVTVNGTAGPFVITSQGAATSWTAATTQTITWSVAGTSVAPVSTPSVNIFFSTDGGYTYPITLATNVLNNGTAVITVPSTITTTGRVMVRGAGNIFYDINNANITIVAAPAATPVSNFSVTSSNLCTTSSIQLTDQSLNAPTSWTWTATSGTGVAFSNANAQNPTVTFANAGTYTISLIAKNTLGNSTSTKTITVNATPVVSVNSSTICSGSSAALIATGANTYSWNTGATTSSISVSPTANANYTITGISNGCSSVQLTNVTVNALPILTVNSATICAGSTGTLSAAGANTYTWNTGASGSILSVSPTVNTNYTVTGTSIEGCIKTNTASVSIGSAPSIAVNSSSICAGSTTTLNASGVTTYTWSTGSNAASVSVAPTSTSVYTVSGNLAGCATTAINTVTVSVISNPVVSVNSSTICSGNSAALNATGATTYSWNTTATTNSISVSPTSTTNYSVTGTTNGCVNTKVTTVTVKATPTVAVNSSTICSGNSAALIASGATTYSWNTTATTNSISVSPTSTTNYSVTGTTNGCVNTKVTTVTVKATPTVAVNSSTICSGNSAALIASGATTYSWNTTATTNSISVSPTSTTNYSVTGTTNGCVNTKVTTVTVKATPTVAVNSSTICSGNSAALIASGATTYSWNTTATTNSISVSPTSTTNYSVTGTNNGCVNTKVTTVTVNATPTVAVNSSTICSGNSAALIASGATTYSWNTTATTNSISVSPTTNTNYSVTGSTNGCSDIQIASVTVNALPNVIFDAVSGPLCASNSSIALSGSPAGGVFSGIGVSGSAFDPAISGVGTFTLDYNYTDANSCAAIASQTVGVDLCTGINEINDNSFIVFPNPTTGNFSIDFKSNSIQNASIEIFDAIGKLVLTETISNKNTSISFEHFSKGIYSVRIKNNGTYFITRVIKQ